MNVKTYQLPLFTIQTTKLVLSLLFSSCTFEMKIMEIVYQIGTLQELMLLIRFDLVDFIWT